MNASVQLHILKTLHDAAGHPLPEDVLKLQVDSRARPRPTAQVFKDCIAHLKSIGHIVDRANELEPANPWWMLDEKGEAYAAKQRW